MLFRLSMVVFGVLLGTAAHAQEIAGDAERGESLYVSTGCYECHGFVGQGGAPGPVIAPPMPFRAVSFSNFVSRAK